MNTNYMDNISLAKYSNVQKCIKILLYFNTFLYSNTQWRNCGKNWGGKTNYVNCPSIPIYKVKF